MRESPRPVTEVSEKRAGKLKVRFDMKPTSLCEASKPVKSRGESVREIL